MKEKFECTYENLFSMLAFYLIVAFFIGCITFNRTRGGGLSIKNGRISFRWIFIML